MSEKYKVLRVTMTKDYLVKMIDNERTEINGWPMQQVIQDWFFDTDLRTYHATRNGHEIGNSEQILEIEELDE